MFTTLRKDSMEDVGKGPLKMGDAMYQHTACIHCKRRKVSVLFSSLRLVHGEGDNRF